MKKVLLTLLAIVVIGGVLAGVGLAGYRLGYDRGARAVPAQNAQALPRNDDKFGWDEKRPFHDFDKGIGPGFQRDFGPRGFGMPIRGRGFGFFSPLHFLIQIAIFGLIIWLAYKLLTGWRIKLVQPNSSVTKVEPVEQEPKATDTSG